MLSRADHELPFRLASLIAAGAPDGGEGTWFRYVIAQGANRITGLRCGPEAEVTHLVQDMVDRLNERRVGKNRPRTTKPPQPEASSASKS
jgi:hypothetical protein